MRDLFKNNSTKMQRVKVDGAGDNGDPNAAKSVRVTRWRTDFHARRIAGEIALEKELPWHMEPGMSYHCFSFGDVDAFSYIRAIAKQQPIEYLIVSTWAMSPTDITELAEWRERGVLGGVDFYLGEIFQSSYALVYEQIREFLAGRGGRIAIFRNHAKVCVGFGRDFDFVLETSANFNNNPRSEQAVITCSSELARWYKEEVFDGINSFNKDFPDWVPYKLMRDRDENDFV